jgi:Tol biopolymer transport system component
VYLAEDTRLGRRVALKILPPALTADPARTERFEREARAVASLNHPSIVTLHSIDQAAGTQFLTMEYVDGSPLSELIPKHGLPLDRLLRIAIPLADAVGAAHQRGILHRDLKPANVMVTGDGRVKVLDFGLAKLQEDVNTADALPTQELTGEGRIVGTIAYMSPEQAEGKTVDQRSDAFSLGVMLYEMGSGRRPFTGDTSLSVLSAILKDAPRPLAEIRPDLPRDFVRIVKRALNKDPEERYQSAKDLRADLHVVLEDLSSGELSRPSPAAPARTLSAATLTALLAAGVAAGVAAWAVTTRGRAGTSATTPGAGEWTPTRITSTGLVRNQVAISADGRYVAYSQLDPDGQSLRLRQIATSSEVVVRPAERVGIDGIAFSREGNFIYYSTYPAGDNAATLYRVPTIGGAPQRLQFNIETAVTFSPDGARMAFAVEEPSGSRSLLEVANADGSGRRMLAELKWPRRFLQQARPAWSPDGSVIAHAVIDGAGQAIALVDTATGTVRVPGEKRWPFASSVAWMPGGRDLIASLRETGYPSTQMWRVDAATGAATSITRDLFNYGDLSMSADGRQVAVVATIGESTLWIAEADNMSALEQATTGAADGEGFLGVGWTRDGGFVYVSRAGGNPDLWSLDPKTRARHQLTSDPADDFQPVTSPDGRSIAFASGREGGIRIWVMNADGTDARAVSPGPNDQYPAWTPDSSEIAFSSGQTLTLVSPEGSNLRALTNHWPARPGEPARTFVGRSISRQGMVAGYEEVDPQRGGGWRLAYAPLDGSGPVKTLEQTVNSTLAPLAWAPDGQAIDLVRPPVGGIWRYAIDGRPGSQLTAFSGPAVTRSFAWSPDGGRLLISRGENKSDVVLFRQAESR